MNDFITTAYSFLKKYIYIIAPVILGVFFLFIVILSFVESSAPKKIATVTIPTPASSAPVVTSTYNRPVITTPTIDPGEQRPADGIGEEEHEMGWAPVPFSDSDIQGVAIKKTVLADGSAEYTSDSEVPNRPNVTIVKSGIIIFQSKPMHNLSFSDYANFYGQPEYKVTGSKFWGANIITYIYLSRGAALVINPSSQMILEQQNFKPVAKDAFKATYGSDLLGELQ